MKTRTTLILALIAAVLVIVAILSGRTEKSRERIAPGPIFPELQREAVAEIRLTSASEDKEVHLKKEPSGWAVLSEGGFPADTTAIQKILDKTEAFDQRHLRSSNPEMQRTFEVDDSSGTEVLLADASGTPLAHFRLGKNGPDFRSHYLRPVQSDNVYLIPVSMRSDFNLGRQTWRDKTVFAFDAAQVQRLTMQSPDQDNVTLVRDSLGTFTMTAPEEAGVKRALAESTLRALSMLSCDGFPDSLPSLADAGLDPPLQRVEVLLDDGATYGLNIGNEVENRRHYATRDGDDMIFLLSQYKVKSILREAEELKETPPPAAEGAEASE